MGKGDGWGEGFGEGMAEGIGSGWGEGFGEGMAEGIGSGWGEGFGEGMAEGLGSGWGEGKGCARGEGHGAIACGRGKGCIARGGGMAEGQGDGQGGIDDEWSVSVFGCFNNIPTCLLGWCVPCILNYLTAEKIGQNGILFFILTICLPWPTAVLLRIKVRQAKGMRDNLLMDVLCGYCLPGCVYCQMANVTGAFR